MKIQVWKSKRTINSVDVEFPIYSRWRGDHLDTVTRLDASGSCISIGKGDNFEGSVYEIEWTKIDLTQPLDGSYVSYSRGDNVCTEADFLAVFDEMIAEIQEARSAIS